MAEQWQAGQAHVVVPGGMRPDGTFRKDVRVRAGYTPPDEVARHEGRSLADLQRAAAQRNKPNRPSYSNSSNSSNSSSKNTNSNSNSRGSDSATAATKAQRKNAARKARRKATAAQEAPLPHVKAHAERTEAERTQAERTVSGVAAAAAAADAEGEARERQRMRKRLEKAVRQTEDLRRRVDDGSVQPNADQQEKLCRLDDLRAQLASLCL